MAGYGKSCDICKRELDEEEPHEHSQCYGDMCGPCIKKKFPEHITEVDGMCFTSNKDVEYIDITNGEKRIIAIDTRYNIAGVGKSKAAAKKLLDKAVRDIHTVEHNERYGNLME